MLSPRRWHNRMFVAHQALHIIHLITLITGAHKSSTDYLAKLWYGKTTLYNDSSGKHLGPDTTTVKVLVVATTACAQRL